MKVIGIMSGTSLDGIDVAIVDILENSTSLIGFKSVPYLNSTKEKVMEASKLDTSNVQKICSLNVELSYLYVDAISYYHKTENTYMVNDKIHYSNKLEYNDKTGYINIEEIDGKYFVQFMFNYAKMEAYVPEEDLTTVVNNMCLVLRTIKFNDDVLESLIGDNVLSYQEENFTLFDTESSNEDFLEVVQDGSSASEKSDFKSDEEVDLNEDY